MTTEEEKIEIVKEFLNRYRNQHTRVEWQKKKMNELKAILSGYEKDDDAINFMPDEEMKEAIGWTDTEKKYKAESIELYKIYREIMNALDSLTVQEQREVLYEKYIHLMSIDGIAYKKMIHPKTVGRKHRTALLAFYDAVFEK